MSLCRSRNARAAFSLSDVTWIYFVVRRLPVLFMDPSSLTPSAMRSNRNWHLSRCAHAQTLNIMRVTSWVINAVAQVEFSSRMRLRSIYAVQIRVFNIKLPLLIYCMP